MKRNIYIVIVFCLVSSIIFLVAGCGGSSDAPQEETAAEASASEEAEAPVESSESTASGEDEEPEESKEPKEPEAPKTRVNNRTDAQVEFVSLDEEGITLRLSVDSQNLMFLPQYFEVAGATYGIFDAEGNLNPAVHFVVDGSDKDSYSVDLKEGKSCEVRISIDGVSDYTHFKMTVDDTIYDDSGRSWQIKDVSVEVITE